MKKVPKLLTKKLFGMNISKILGPSVKLTGQDTKSYQRCRLRINTQPMTLNMNKLIPVNNYSNPQGTVMI